MRVLEKKRKEVGRSVGKSLSNTGGEEEATGASNPRLRVKEVLTTDHVEDGPAVDVVPKHEFLAGLSLPPHFFLCHLLDLELSPPDEGLFCAFQRRGIVPLGGAEAALEGLSGPVALFDVGKRVEIGHLSVWLFGGGVSVQVTMGRVKVQA